MSYFKKFPKIEYENHIVTDITRNIRFKSFLKTNLAAFEQYIVKDGETAESLAYEFYGDANKHWVILIINDIIDPFFDWVLTEDALLSFIDNKYGDGERSSIHHWEKEDVYVPSTTPSAVAITNYQYETLENENKRDIQIVRREHLDRIINEFENKIAV